ncbi:MAG: GNAT family N-acetyltransferase [Synergistaceae bacterium]
MSSYDLFMENFYAMSIMLTRAPKGSLLNISSAIIASSGLPFDDENFLLFGPSANAIHIDCAVGLMPGVGVPFSVPVFSNTDPFMPLLVKDKVACSESSHHVMALSRSGAFEFDKCCELVDEGSIEEFAETVWKGFGTKGKVSEEYLEFARYLLSSPFNRLFILRNPRKKAVSCALLCDSGSSCGVYYFATLPRSRRKGFARRLMSSVASVAFEKYESLVLLSTEDGFPFYSAFGFEDLGVLPVLHCPKLEGWHNF